MGFGFLFIGFMLLYDYEIVLAADGVGYLALDIFPDVLGFLLLFLGLRKLCRKGEDFAFLKKASLFLLPLSVLMLVKGTLLFPAFYDAATGKMGLAATALDVCMRLLKLAFTYLLFQKTAAMAFRLGEPKLSSHHGLIPRIAMVDGVLYLASTALRTFAPQSLLTLTSTVTILELLFWVLLVWFGAICLFRCVLRLSDLSE